MTTTVASRIFVDTNILASAMLPESPRYFHARGMLRRHRVPAPFRAMQARMQTVEHREKFQ